MPKRHPDTGPALCQQCGAQLMFARMRDTRSWLPLDYGTYQPEGTIAAVHTSAGWMDAYYLAEGQGVPPRYRRLMPHWRTCRPPKKTPKREPEPPATLF